MSKLLSTRIAKNEKNLYALWRVETQSDASPTSPPVSLSVLSKASLELLKNKDLFKRIIGSKLLLLKLGHFICPIELHLGGVPMNI